MKETKIIQKVSDLCIKSMKRCVPDKDWREALADKIVSNECRDYKSDVWYCPYEYFFKKYDINENTMFSIDDVRTRQIVSGTLQRFIRKAGNVFGYVTGDNLLRYYMYYRYAEIYPIEVVEMSDVITKLDPNFISTVQDVLYSWLEKRPYYDRLKHMSLEGIALVFVLDRADMTSELVADWKDLDMWFNECLPKKERDELLDFCGSSSGAKLYNAAMRKLTNDVGMIMDPWAFRSTPIVILSMYYAYIYEKLDRRNRFEQIWHNR